MQAIRAARIGGFELMILTETNINDQAHFRNMMGYDVILSKATTTADGDAKGGVGMIIREKPQVWNINSTRFHGPNMVSCKVIYSNNIMPLIREYLPPSTLDYLTDLEETLNCFPRREPIVLGNLNANIGRFREPRDQQVADFLTSLGLVDLLGHFCQRLCYFRLHK